MEHILCDLRFKTLEDTVSQRHYEILKEYKNTFVLIVRKIRLFIMFKWRLDDERRMEIIKERKKKKDDK